MNDNLTLNLTLLIVEKWNSPLELNFCKVSPFRDKIQHKIFLRFESDSYGFNLPSKFQKPHTLT